MIEIENSQDYNSLKETLKKSPSIKSAYKIIGEWNYNAVADIIDFGVYNLPYSTYTAGVGYNSGQALLDYTTILEDDGEFIVDGVTIDNTVYNSYYSLYDCFQPIRPHAGVVYPMAPSSVRDTSIEENKNSIITFPLGIDQLDNLPGQNKPFCKTYLPHKNVKYKYWTSACLGKDGAYVPGMTAKRDKAGNNLYNNAYQDYEFVLKSDGYGRVQPFVVYDRNFYCNLIVLKYQTHLGVPNRFYVDVLQGNQWVEIFDSTDFLFEQAQAGTNLIPKQHSDGVLRIYRETNGTWRPVPSGRNHPEELIDFVTEGGLRTLENGTTKIADFDDEATKIRGLRLRVSSMTNYNVPFELIEMSPRLAVDLTDYTQSFSCSTRVGDGTSSLPTSNIVVGTGSIDLSNAEGGFFNDNPDSILYKSLVKNTMIYPYQTFEINNQQYQIPIKVLYVENWTESENYVVSAQLNDFMKILQSQKVSSTMVSTLYRSVPVSFAIQTVLNGIGFTNFKFLDSNDAAREDIKYFYASDDKTVAEVLDSIAKATQCSIYIDAFNYVVCASKDKVLDKTYIENDKDPLWWLTTEDISISVTSSKPSDPSDPPKRTFTVSEIDYSQDPSGIINVPGTATYLSNIMGINKTQTDPINDGEITYNTKTFKRNKMYAGKDTNKLARTDPMKIAQDRYELNVSGLWFAGGQGGDDTSNDDVLFGGPLLSRISAIDIKDTIARKDGFGSQDNEYKSLNEFLSVKVLNDKSIENNKKLFCVDPFSVYLLRPWSGYMRIDQEIIRYSGIEYSRGSTKKWIFSEEDLEDFKSGASTRDFLRPTGRIAIHMEFDIENPIVNSTTGDVSYKIIDSGRGEFSTKVQAHEVEKFESNNKDYINGWEMDVSFTYKTEDLTPGSSTNKLNVHNIEKSNSRLLLGSTTSETIKDYTGLINLTGLVISGSYGKDLTNNGEKVKDVAKSIKDDIKDRELEGEDNFEDVLRIATTGDLMAQGITKGFNKTFDSMYTSLLFLNKKGRAKNDSTSATLAAGMAIHYNKKTGEGYFIELLGTPTNTEADDVSTTVVVYRVKQSGGTNKITIIDSKTVSGEVYAKEPSWGEVDGFSNLAARIKKPGQFTVYFNNKKILSIDDKKEQTLPSTNDVLLYVRGDTVALFDKFVASAEPTNLNALFLYDDKNTTFKITDDYFNEKSVVKYPDDAIYIEEFGNNINQVQKYKFKYQSYPAAIYEMVDLTPVGAGYFIEDYDLDNFGGEIIVSNKTGKYLSLRDGEKNQLSVIGVTLANSNDSRLTVDSFIADLPTNSDLKQKILSSRRRSSRVAFNLKSDYIQSLSSARKLMEWMISNSYKEFSLASVEMFANPLIELTDVVKIYSPRNNMDESYYTVTALEYEIGQDGPKMTLEVREIG